MMRRVSSATAKTMAMTNNVVVTGTGHPARKEIREQTASVHAAAQRAERRLCQAGRAARLRWVFIIDIRMARPTRRFPYIVERA